MKANDMSPEELMEIKDKGESGGANNSNKEVSSLSKQNWGCWGVALFGLWHFSVLLIIICMLKAIYLQPKGWTHVCFKLKLAHLRRNETEHGLDQLNGTIQKVGSAWLQRYFVSITHRLHWTVLLHSNNHIQVYDPVTTSRSPSLPISPSESCV